MLTVSSRAKREPVAGLDRHAYAGRCLPFPRAQKEWPGIYGHGHGGGSVCDGYHGNRHQEPWPVDSYLAHAARRPYVGEELVEDLG